MEGHVSSGCSDETKPAIRQILAASVCYHRFSTRGRAAAHGRPGEEPADHRSPQGEDGMTVLFMGVLDRQVRQFKCLYQSSRRENSPDRAFPENQRACPEGPKTGCPIYP